MPRLIDADRLKGYLYENYVMYDHTLADIDAQPTVDAEPVRHGRWVNHISENGATDGTYCSICDYEVDRGARYNYCPNCGARMDESTMGQVKPNDGERKEDATG